MNLQAFWICQSFLVCVKNWRNYFAQFCSMMNINRLCAQKASSSIWLTKQMENVGNFFFSSFWMEGTFIYFLSCTHRIKYSKKLRSTPDVLMWIRHTCLTYFIACRNILYALILRHHKCILYHFKCVSMMNILRIEWPKTELKQVLISNRFCCCCCCCSCCCCVRRYSIFTSHSYDRATWKQMTSVASCWQICK